MIQGKLVRIEMGGKVIYDATKPPPRAPMAMPSQEQRIKTLERQVAELISIMQEDRR